MSIDTFDDDLHNYLDEKDHECNMCGKAIDYEGYCSRACREADER